MLVGADLDESPMAYRRLPEVLAQHAGTVRVLHTLRPFAVDVASGVEASPGRKDHAKVEEFIRRAKAA